jgi:DNA-binding response OmpR family regulator
MDAAIDTHIVNLRRKVKDPQKPRYIVSVRGFGYRFEVGGC